MPNVTQQFHGSFIGNWKESDFLNQIRAVNYMTFLRYIRDDDADAIWGCLRPNCSDPNKIIEARKARLVDVLINVFASDPDAKIPSVCQCANLIEAVCCNANYSDVATYYNAQTDTDSFFI